MSFGSLYCAGPGIDGTLFHPANSDGILLVNKEMIMHVYLTGSPDQLLKNKTLIKVLRPNIGRKHQLGDQS